MNPSEPFRPESQQSSQFPQQSSQFPQSTPHIQEELPAPPVFTPPPPAGFFARLRTWFSGLSRAGQVGVGCGALIFMCACCGTMPAVLSGAGGTASPTQGIILDATDTPAPRPTATPTVDSQKLLAALYAAVVTKHTTTVSADASAVGTSCSAADFTGCRADLVTFQADVRDFQQDLKTTTVPSCLAQVNSDITRALEDYNQGASITIQGIDDLSASEINSGASLISQGNVLLKTATAETKSANC